MYLRIDIITLCTVKIKIKSLSWRITQHYCLINYVHINFWAPSLSSPLPYPIVIKRLLEPIITLFMDKGRGEAGKKAREWQQHFLGFYKFFGTPLRMSRCGIHPHTQSTNVAVHSPLSLFYGPDCKVMGRNLKNKK